MSKLTITEALQEIKTIDKRAEKKREFVSSYVWRYEALKDPLVADGGSSEALYRERQALADLAKRRIGIRLAIQKANLDNELTVCGETHSIAWWLTWRREVVAGDQQFLSTLARTIGAARQQAQSKGNAIIQASATVGETKPGDVVINLDEAGLAKEREHVEEILSTLDGQLSLKNALIMVEVE